MNGVYQGRRRMTLTYPIINRARRILWLVTGSEKAGMLVRLRDGRLRTCPTDARRCPVAVRKDLAVAHRSAPGARSRAGRLGRRKRPKTWKELAQTVESV